MEVCLNRPLPFITQRVREREREIVSVSDSLVITRSANRTPPSILSSASFLPFKLLFNFNSRRFKIFLFAPSFCFDIFLPLYLCINTEQNNGNGFRRDVGKDARAPAIS
ncbi:hypothetical protein Ancab_037886 [Ancistrocladus abbreviatus]